MVDIDWLQGVDLGSKDGKYACYSTSFFTIWMLNHVNVFIKRENVLNKGPKQCLA